MLEVKFTFEKVLEQVEFLVDPECTIPEQSIAIHHITQDMVTGKPKIHEVLPCILTMAGKYPIVGHGIKFDIDLIAHSASQHNLPCSIQHNSYIDTLRLARLYGESPVNSLEQLRRHFNIEPEGAHRAMSDVLVNMEVFKYLAARYKTTEALFEVLSKPILMKVMPLGKHKGRPMKEVPLEYLQWAAHKDFDMDLLYSIRSEIKRRKKGNLFTQVANPFKNL